MLFLWQNGVKTDLGALSNGGIASLTLAELYQRLRPGDRPGGPGYPYSRAFLWANGVMKDLGTLGALFPSFFGINNSGQVVRLFSPGWRCAQACCPLAERDDTDLGTLGGQDSFPLGH